MQFTLSLASGNRKTGPIAVATSSSDTCPDACPLKDRGCYARFGMLGMYWRRLDKNTENTFEKFLDKLKYIYHGCLFRYAQAGDLPGEGNKIDTAKLIQLVNAAKHTRAFTYTHKPVGGKNKNNTEAVKWANENGMTINLSADSLVEADFLANLKIGPVVTTLPTDAPKTSFTPQGRKVVVCPAQYMERVTCESCGLCQKNQRTVIVGFRAHGTGKSYINQKNLL